MLILRQKKCRRIRTDELLTPSDSDRKEVARICDGTLRSAFRISTFRVSVFRVSAYMAAKLNLLPDRQLRVTVAELERGTQT